MILNESQSKIVDEAEHFYRHESRQVYEFTGGAGTGKSTVLMAIAMRLGIPLERIACATYVGAAAIVLRRKGFFNAKTIHSWLFHPAETYKLDKQGRMVINSYLNKPELELAFEPKSLDNIDLIFIDEGYQVPYKLKYEIESRGIKIIVCGDKNQLPPVADKPAYLYRDDIPTLNMIMRQRKNSGILYIADRILKGLEIHRGFYNEVLVIEEDELTNQMILNSDIIICARNSTREKLNKKIRHEILGIKSDLPLYKEKVICRKNNWQEEVDGISLANGLIGTISNSPDVGSFDGKNFKINFKPDMMDMEFKDLVCDYNYLIAPYNIKQQLKNDRYNPNANKFEFAYSSTTHLVQGSQFGFGIFYDEFLNKDIQKQLEYTAVTRFVNGLIFVKRKRKYYSIPFH